MSTRRWVLFLLAVLAAGVILGAVGSIALKVHGDWTGAVTAAATGVAAVFAPLAGFAAFLAARQSAEAARTSAQAARESRRALSLHYRPTFSVTTVAGRGPDEPPFDDLPAVYPGCSTVMLATVEFLNEGGVRDAVVEWVTAEGVPHSATWSPGVRDIVLTGVRGTEGPKAAIPDVASFSVRCRDVPTGALWRRSVGPLDWPEPPFGFRLAVELAGPVDEA